MIGNDIVDIPYSRQFSDWKRPGYLEKLFTCKERLQIKESTCSERMVWRLWSMKESAYKAAFRNSKERVFNPGKFICTTSDEVGGKVHFKDRVFHTHSSINGSSIHSVAWEEGGDPSRLSSVLKKFDTKLSSADLYQYLLKKVAVISNCKMKDLTLKKTLNGIPEIFNKGEKVDVLCSLSHHGDFGAILIYH
ncbi:4'-phosphopantetheinyl transferase family protein [Lutimonas sp.]|uniref:4'-phosphopantetheinyl transferase family protein n=1 Tax=Lutimonas sp. TaxID=1872403 RepID=UPI003D9B274A